VAEDCGEHGTGIGEVRQHGVGVGGGQLGRADAPVATPTDRAPAAWAAATSSGVSPTMTAAWPAKSWR
jgi:hypothetical protein